MKKQKLHLVALVIPAILATTSANSQSFCTITGTVWQDSRTGTNGIYDESEPGIPGVLVSLYNASGDSLIASTISQDNGQYTIDNYRGEGTYFLSFNFPEEGYMVTSYRSGSDTAVNNAVTDYGEDDLKRTDDIVIDASHDGTVIENYNLGLVVQNNKMVYSTYKTSTSTEWSDTLKLPKSEESVGTLSRARLFVTNAAHHPSIGVENTSITSASTGTVDLGGKITVRPPNNNTTGLVSQTSFLKAAAFPVYDGVTDYEGLSGETWNYAYGAGFDDYNYPTSRNSDFVGADSVAVPILASGTVTITGGGNLTVNVATYVSAGLFVIYEYDGGVLPVTLSRFEAEIENNFAAISWKTSSEINNQGFSVQRSGDGQSFSDIGFVSTLAPNGNSSEELLYRFKDEKPLAGKNIYRLKQTDIDGKVAYSAVRTLNFNKVDALSIYPNPASGTLNIVAEDINSVSVQDISGKQITAPVTIYGTRTVIDISKLIAGIYSLQVTSNNGSVQQLRFTKY